jgi:hypothetical protein
MNLPYEVQCFKPFENEDGKNEFTIKLKQKFDFDDVTEMFSKCVKKYQTFPKELTASEYEKLRQIPSDTEEKAKPTIPVSVGLDYVNFCPVVVDAGESHVIAVYAKKDFGKPNLINLLLGEIIKQKSQARLVLFDDGRNELKPIYEKYSSTVDCVLINKFEESELPLNDGTTITKKLSSLQQFYLYLNKNYLALDKGFLAEIYGLPRDLKTS